MTQIIPVVSDALQATIRRLLPSQRGFGEDLMASNVITPIIDLTPSAEGSQVPVNLQTAWDFATDFTYVNAASTTTLISNTGFWQVDVTAIVNTGVGSVSTIQINDGASQKKVWEVRTGLGAGGDIEAFNKFVVFLRPGDTLELVLTSANHAITTWYRQIATVDGVLVNPLGFNPQ